MGVNPRAWVNPRTLLAILYPFGCLTLSWMPSALAYLFGAILAIAFLSGWLRALRAT